MPWMQEELLEQMCVEINGLEINFDAHTAPILRKGPQHPFILQARSLLRTFWKIWGEMLLDSVHLIRIRCLQLVSGMQFNLCCRKLFYQKKKKVQYSLEKSVFSISSAFVTLTPVLIPHLLLPRRRGRKWPHRAGRTTCRRTHFPRSALVWTFMQGF